MNNPTNRIFKYMGEDKESPAERFNLDYDLGKRMLLASIIHQLKEIGWTGEQASSNVDAIFQIVEGAEDDVLRSVTASIYRCAMNPEFDRKELKEVFIPIFWAHEGRKLAERIYSELS